MVKLSFELAQQEREIAQQEREIAQQERERADRAEEERQQAEAALAEERRQKQQLWERLKEMGIDPNQLS
ncbi:MULTISPECIES: hypothetical protein [Planktothricoides]|uniref:Uma2 family endonuclease n=1 Tax=Planktothricoides raciborskii GIHE-MW2 TaxID=2792601 RepID=A0AAU8JJW6_9CYAN